MISHHAAFVCLMNCSVVTDFVMGYLYFSSPRGWKLFPRTKALWCASEDISITWVTHITIYCCPPPQKLLLGVFLLAVLKIILLMPSVGTLRKRSTVVFYLWSNQRSKVRSRIWAYCGNFRFNPGFVSITKVVHLLQGYITVITYAADINCLHLR